MSTLVPYEVICLLSEVALRSKQLELAVALRLMFLLYLRPSEITTLRAEDSEDQRQAVPP